MSELDWENPPPVKINVPLVRPWGAAALRDWNRAIYPPRRGTTVVFGCLFIVPWAFFQAIKFWIWLAGVAFVVVAECFWITAELITYRYRRKREMLRVWQKYYADVNAIDPPASAA